MKNIVLILLFALCCFLFVSLNIKQKALDKAFFEKESLSEDLKRTIKLKGRTLMHKARVCSDKTLSSVETSEVKSEVLYIPPESSFNYSEAIDGSYEIDVKNYGLTLKPYIGGIFNSDGKASGVVGLRLFYYGHWGLGSAYAFKNGLMLSAERRIDDLLPLDNTALFFGINKNTAAFGAVVFL